MKKLRPDQREYMEETPEDMILLQFGAVRADGVYTLRLDRARYLVRQLRAITRALGETPDLRDVKERIETAPDTIEQVQIELGVIYDGLNGLETGRRRDLQPLRDAIWPLLGKARKPQPRSVDQRKPVSDNDAGPYTIGQLATKLDCEVVTVRRRLAKHPEVQHVDRVGRSYLYAAVDVDRLKH